MKTVLLLRHGKSAWSTDGLSDRERPLSPRGLKSAPRMGRYITKNGWIPDVVICSPAQRAIETCMLAIEQFTGAPEIITCDALYDFSGEGAYLDAIRNTPKSAETTLLVGHNPTLYYLSQILAGAGDVDLRADMSLKFPTAALAVITFNVTDWRDVGPGLGILIDFAKPRALKNI